MAKCNIKLLNEHSRNFVRMVMADQLHKEGYVSKRGNDLQWYRVVDGNVLQAVFFYTQWAYLPMMINIGYSCHPLFITPEYPSGVHIRSSHRSTEAFNPGRPIMNPCHNAVFSPDAAVLCPDDAYKGADILADILSRLNSVNSAEQCYTSHKQRFSTVAEQMETTVEELYQRFSVDFMDEIVFFDDQELLPYCADRITREIERYNKAQAVRKLWDIEIKQLESLKLLKSAVWDNEREQHLLHLHQKQIENILQLKRKVKGIPGL